MIVAGVEFKKSKVYYFEDGKIYRRANSGSFEEKWSITRKVGVIKIHAEHFNCALPYTKYYLINTNTGCVFESEDVCLSHLNEIVNELKMIQGIE